MPEARVTMRKECCPRITHKEISVMSDRVEGGRRRGTYDDLEDEVARHEGELEAGRARDSLELGEQAEDDGEEHHEDSQTDGRENTGDDADHDIGEFAKPVEPSETNAELGDVRDDTDKRD